MSPAISTRTSSSPPSASTLTSSPTRPSTPLTLSSARPGSSWPPCLCWSFSAWSLWPYCLRSLRLWATAAAGRASPGTRSTRWKWTGALKFFVQIITTGSWIFDSHLVYFCSWIFCSFTQDFYVFMIMFIYIYMCCLI